MSLQPQGEALRKAVKYIAEEKTASPEASLNHLIQKACMKFDLTPKDTDYLNRFYREQKA